MTLTELLQSQFRGDIRFRGVAYLKAERVEISHVTSENVHALVRDGTDYQTQLTREDGQLKCTAIVPPEAVPNRVVSICGQQFWLSKRRGF